MLIAAPTRAQATRKTGLLAGQSAHSRRPTPPSREPPVITGRPPYRLSNCPTTGEHAPHVRKATVTALWIQARDQPRLCCMGSTKSENP